MDKPSDDLTFGQPELGQIGQLLAGTVQAVFRWGVILDLGLSRVGLIDVLYIDDDDRYTVGQVVDVYVDDFDEQKDKFIARPPAQIPLTERLRTKRATCSRAEAATLSAWSASLRVTFAAEGRRATGWWRSADAGNRPSAGKAHFHAHSFFRPA